MDGSALTLIIFFFVAIIVGSIVAAILIVAVIACIMSWAYQFGERPRMKRRPKRTVFQDQ